MFLYLLYGESYVAAFMFDSIKLLINAGPAPAVMYDY